MKCKALTPGANAPNEINVLIEIPAHSDPVKYETDKTTDILMVNRFMATAMRYPCNYGYIPQTLAADDDPVDVLVITPFPLLSGSIIKCRPIGVLKMTDEAGEDDKLLAVPDDGLTDLYKDVHTYTDLPQSFLHAIRHFFEHYKDLEVGKWVKVENWYGPEVAREIIVQSIKRFK